MELLLGFYQPQQGEILIDGKNIQNYSLSSLRKLYSFIGQQTFLMNTSLKENLLMGEDFSQQQLLEALEQAALKEKSLEENIGDRGQSLSGGEGQRLSLARNQLQKGSIQLFDEATSALDNQSEQIITNNIFHQSEKTQLVIAHRLSSIQQFPRIIFLEKGSIQEEGKHSELMEKKGRYYQFFRESQGG